MGRGVSAGGGQSSLGYLFGGGETSNDSLRASRSEGQISNNTTAAPIQPLDNTQQIQAETKSAGRSPTGTHDSKKNNYYRPDGQNCGNFITDRPSTKVHAAPGGGSSLGYLFGDGKN